MICPHCKKNIKGANKQKVKGVWFHKVCPSKQRRNKTGKKFENHKKPYRKIRLRRKVHNKIVE